jgi:hypothetical protein
MNPITIKMFVSQSSGVASAPGGPGSGNLQLRSVPSTAPASPGPNDAILAAPPVGNVMLNASGLLASIQAQLPQGTPITVTITSP